MGLLVKNPTHRKLKDHGDSRMGLGADVAENVAARPNQNLQTESKQMKRWIPFVVAEAISAIPLRSTPASSTFSFSARDTRTSSIWSFRPRYE